jgi:hypothetical protein
MASISLGGKDWEIPQLAVKQNRIVDPLIISLLPVFSTWTTDKNSITKIGKEQYDALLTIAYTAITRAKPDFKLAEFEELPVTLPELIFAFTVIAQQTGVFARGTPGEAPAA